MDFYCPGCSSFYSSDQNELHSSCHYSPYCESPRFVSQEAEVTCVSPDSLLLSGSSCCVSESLNGTDRGGQLPTFVVDEESAGVHSGLSGQFDDLVCHYRGSSGRRDNVCADARSSSVSSSSSSSSSSSPVLCGSEYDSARVCGGGGASPLHSGGIGPRVVGLGGGVASGSEPSDDRRVRPRLAGSGGSGGYVPLELSDSEDEVIAVGAVPLGVPLDPVQAAACDIADLRADVPMTDVGAGSGQFTAYRLLATYPQNPLKKEVMLERIRKHFARADIRLIIVCEENHHDEESVAVSRVGVHLHVLIWFGNGQKHTRKIWDSFGDNRGVHLARCGSTDQHHRRTVKYVCKDGNYVCDPPGYEAQWLQMAEVVKTKKAGKFEIIANLVREGKTDQEINELHPGFVLNHSQKIDMYRSMVEKWNQGSSDSLPAFTRRFFVEDVGQFHEIVQWFSDNYWHPVFVGKRPIKTPNLWIRAPSSFGKTWLFDALCSYLRVWIHPMEDSGWADTYEDGLYDLIVFDEFKGGMKIQEFNKWCDGSRIPVKRRGKQPITKCQNVPVLVLSNFLPEACWHNVNQHDRTSILAVCSRFKICSYDGEPGTLAKIISPI